MANERGIKNFKVEHLKILLACCYLNKKVFKELKCKNINLKSTKNVEIFIFSIIIYYSLLLIRSYVFELCHIKNFCRFMFTSVLQKSKDNKPSYHFIKLNSPSLLDISYDLVTI